MSYDKLTMEYTEQSIAKLKLLNFRLYPDSDAERNREAFSRDYARVLYSSSFRRLQGKMQLLGVDHNHFFRNRLTHSMEVAQIARGIAMDLKLDTTFVVETCSLAHDLGNPPIGHHGEQILSNLITDIGGFEGNAQTLRIIRKLEKKHHAYRGLNLTFRTQLGVVKYYAKFDSGINQKFIYDDDYDDIKFNLDKLKLKEKDAKTIDMEIMDLADEIAYAAHDLEDCLNQELFSIDELLFEFSLNEEYSEANKVLEEIIQNCKKFARQGRNFLSSEEYSFLFRKELTSKIVNTLIHDIAYQANNDKLGFTHFGKLSKGLKKLVFQLINRKASVQLYEKIGEKALRGLYDVYTDEQINKNLTLLPPEYRIYKTHNEFRRNVIDFISGMMDHFAIQEYKKYYGNDALDKLK